MNVREGKLAGVKACMRMSLKAWSSIRAQGEEMASARCVR